MRTRSSMAVLYTALGLMALFFLFPFYWAIISSLKTTAGLTMIPPTFLPSETTTVDLSLFTSNRLVRAREQTWFKLCDHELEDRELGAYYVRLDDGKPSQFVQRLADTELDLAPVADDHAPTVLVFSDLPVCKVKGMPQPLARVARMLRRHEGKTAEWFFAAPLTDANERDCQVLLNPEYSLRRHPHARWRNYPETLRGPEATFGAESGSGFLLFMRNSFIISFFAVVGQVFSSSLVAFGFARMRFKGREFLFILLLATLMVPAQVTLIPLFSIYKCLGWIDTFLPLIVPHFTAGAFNVFLVRQYMLTLPYALDESAAMDGATPWQTYRHVILPNCAPILIVVGLFTFVYTWQNVMGPLIYLDDPALRTVPLGLEYFRSPYVDNRHLLMTGAVLAMLPVAIVFLIAQRYIMSGIATTGLKG